MSANHTPGPWSLGKVGKHTQHIDGGNGGTRWWGLCKVFVRVEGEPYAIGEANALLIAAAPCLLGALQRIDSEMVLGAELDRIVTAAIAKATGAQP